MNKKSYHTYLLTASRDAIVVAVDVDVAVDVVVTKRSMAKFSSAAVQYRYALVRCDKPTRQCKAAKIKNETKVTGGGE